MNQRRDHERRLNVGLIILAIPVLFVVAALLIVLVGPPGASSRGGRGNSDGTAAPRTPDLAESAQTQPSATGYEYRVTEERYLVLQQDGSLQNQQRRRESWTAPDGWAWARQTGFDPTRFVLPPSSDWKAIRSAEPTAADVARVLTKTVATVPASERASAELNYVNDLLGTETLPASCLPLNYRRAIVAALARNPRATVKRQVADPRGRRGSTQISVSSTQATISIFLDPDLQYLAYTGQGIDGERAMRVVVQERHVDQIPSDLLAQLGTERVEKVIRE